jgi:hypothetical protein
MLISHIPMRGMVSCVDLTYREIFDSWPDPDREYIRFHAAMQ